MCTRSTSWQARETLTLTPIRTLTLISPSPRPHLALTLALTLALALRSTFLAAASPRKDVMGSRDGHFTHIRAFGPKPRQLD